MTLLKRQNDSSMFERVLCQVPCWFGVVVALGAPAKECTVKYPAASQELLRQLLLPATSSAFGAQYLKRKTTPKQVFWFVKRGSDFEVSLALKGDRACRSQGPMP